MRTRANPQQDLFEPQRVRTSLPSALRSPLLRLIQSLLIEAVADVEPTQRDHVAGEERHE